MQKSVFILKSRTAWVSLLFLVLISGMAICAPWVTQYSFEVQNIAERLQLPSLHHWMGTDILGRDLYSRIVYGARMSLAVGICSAGVALVFGTTIGAIAGYSGGWIDALLMRTVDLLLIFPSVLLAILVMLLFGRGFMGILIALGITSWTSQARLVRGQVLQAQNLLYVEAARALGVSPTKILFQHILPNIWGPILVALSMQIPTQIMAESFLSFIGLGLQPPYSSWGTLANEGFRAMQSFPHLMIFPGLALFLTLLAFQYLGDGLQGLFEKKMKHSLITLFIFATSATSAGLHSAVFSPSLAEAKQPPRSCLDAEKISSLSHFQKSLSPNDDSNQDANRCISYCGLSSLDLALYPLEPSVENLIKKSCSQSSSDLVKHLKPATQQIKTKDLESFLNHLAQSHPQAQERLFNYMTSMSPRLIKTVILKISQVKPQISEIINDALTEVGQKKILAALQSTEKQLHIKILTRETNPASLKYLGMGYPSKPMMLKSKTADKGIVAGLVPIDQNLSKTPKRDLQKYTALIHAGIQNGIYKAVPLEEDGSVGVIAPSGRQCWQPKKDLKPTDRVIEVVGDAASGLPITGDLDLALITHPSGKTKKPELYTQILTTPLHGVESPFETIVREKINEVYQSQIQPGALTQTRRINNLVNHGPEVRNPARNAPAYPWINSHGIKITQGSSLDPHRNLRTYLERLNAKNQVFDLPDHWRPYFSGLQNWTHVNFSQIEMSHGS